PAVHPSTSAELHLGSFDCRKVDRGESAGDRTYPGSGPVDRCFGPKRPLEIVRTPFRGIDRPLPPAPRPSRANRAEVGRTGLPTDRYRLIEDERSDARAGDSSARA